MSSVQGVRSTTGRWAGRSQERLAPAESAAGRSGLRCWRGLWFGRGCIASFGCGQQREGAAYEFFGGGYPQRGTEALDDSVHRVQEEADHLSTAAGGLPRVAYELAFRCAESGVEFVFDYPALGCVSGQGRRSVGLYELYALFYADYGEGSSGHELVLRGELGKLSPHGLEEEPDDAATVVGFLFDDLL